MGRRIATGAALAVLILGSGLLDTPQARGLTPENRSELANVPREWSDAKICFHEGGGIGGPRVVIGIEDRGPGTRTFFLRPEGRDARLPEYLLKQAGDLADRQMQVIPGPGVGYTDEYSEVFVMPNGIRLTCEALPDA